MSRFNGHESFIHSYETNVYHVRESLTLIEDPDSHRTFLQNFYTVVIGSERWPENTLPLLYSGFEQILMTLDAAWLTYEEHLNIRERFGDREPDCDLLEPSFSDYSLNDYYPYLQASKWPSERFRRFRGRIQLLNQQEIEIRHLVYEQLFDYQSQGDWKRHFVFWLEAALDDRPIFSSHEFSPAQLHQHYLLLLKMTERVWLDDRQDSGLLYHELMPWFDLNNFPVFGTMDHSLNPYREIYGCFHSKSLTDYKTQLDGWIKVVLNPGERWQKEPVDLLLLFRNFVLMADSLWLIRQLGSNYPREWNRSNTVCLDKHADVPDADYPYLLSGQLLKKPENYLRDFFDQYSLNDVFRLFFEAVVGAFGDSDFSITPPEEVMRFHQDSLRLLEAAFLIQAKKYPQEQGMNH